MPKVSVIVPAYNREKYIGECLDSLLSQTYGDLEVIVVDDGSTDSTPEIAEEYRRRYGEKVKLKRLKENSGLSVASNEGIRMAEGELICFCDSDDWFHPQRVEKMVKALEENPQKVVIGTNIVLYDETEGKEVGVISRGIFSQKLGENAFLAVLENLYKHGCCALGGVFMARRFVFEEEFYDPTLSRGQDGDLVLRLAYRYPQGFLFIDEPLYFWRQHSGQLTKNPAEGYVSPLYFKFPRFWRRDLALPPEDRERYLSLRKHIIRQNANTLLREGYYKEAFEFYREIMVDEPLPLRLIYRFFMLFPFGGRLAINLWHSLKGVKK